MKPRMAIRPGEIFFFYTFLDRAGDREMEHWAGHLSADEADKAQTFSLEKKKREFLVSRALVRFVLSECSGLLPSELTFFQNRHGKPELKTAGTGLRFSLSHSGNMVACGIARDRNLGIDVEDTNRNVNLAIADRFFRGPEINWIREPVPRAEHESRDRFLRIWTLKEAYIKARGKGLSMPLNLFSFGFCQGVPSVCFDESMDDAPESWSFYSFDLCGYKAAAALQFPCDQHSRLKILHCIPFQRTDPECILSHFQKPLFP